MIRKISDIMKEKERTYSFEFFPPKTDKGRDSLMNTAAVFKELRPDWFSVTYGAGGATRESTTEIADGLQRQLQIPVMHHLTCVGHSPAELKSILTGLREKDIPNILALHGDPPQDLENWTCSPDAFDYCYQLIELIRSFDDFFSIGVAGFPEGHIDCPDRDTDAEYLKLKIGAGGEFVITQLFFDNRDYFEYLARLRKIGVTARVIPGILTITDYQKLLKFCDTCGATIPPRVHDIFRPLAGDSAATVEAGTNFAVAQCNELLEGGAPGLHFYSLNRVEPTRRILEAIKR